MQHEQHHDDDDENNNGGEDSKVVNSGDASKPLADTAFRVEEKRYKLYKPTKVNRRLVQPPETDFSRVIDFAALERNHEMHCGKIRRVDAVAVPCLVHADLPGLVFLPGFLSVAQQQYWVRRCMTEFSGPPHPNNESNLAQLRQMQMQHEQEEQPSPPAAAVASATATSAASSTPAAATAVGYRSGLRWATLGYSYNWTQKSYREDERSPFPPQLAALCAAIVKEHFAKVAPPETAKLADGYRAETAIVNYFPSGSAMCAHQDVSEAALERPLVSMSLGCSAVFLMGTSNRDDRPQALWLRSGDVVVFSGKCRDAFHAVPRVMDDAPVELLLPVVGGLPGLRLNINIRQVFDDEHGPQQLPAPVMACARAKRV
jgi:alkylated DNA repair protein alkB family protein 1